MLLGNLLTVAVLALTSVSANPISTLEERNPSPCTGGSFWQSGKCACPHKEQWDWDKKQCKKECIPKPSCNSDEKPWCLKSKDDYCGWDKEKPECEDDNHNIAFCCKDKDLPDRIRSHYPDKEEDHHCKDEEGYKWHPEKKQCQCDSGKKWDGQHCQWGPMPKPNCPEGQKPWCGEDKDKYCGYDEKAAYCKGDGRHHTWCCEDKDAKKWCEKLFGGIL